jgi:large subunit ribosomal protein L9
MKVILLKDVPALGRSGEIRDVKDGFARNYLLPRGFAALATDKNLQNLAHTREAAQAREARVLRDLGGLKQQLESLVVEVRAKAGDEGRLFGSVTAQDIAEAISRKGVEVSKKQVEILEPIKTTGFYKIPIRLHHQHTAMVEVNVVGTS